MTSTYTTNQGLEKPAAGDQSGTWGGTVNTNMDIIDRAICGVASLTLTGSTTTLTTTDGTLTDGMYRVLILGDGGDLGSDNTITISPNDQSKCYLVYNNLTANRNAIFTQGSGANATVENGETAWIYADGAGGGAAVRTALSSTKLLDQDGDTGIRVEEGGDDDDTIRFDIAGAEDFTMTANTLSVLSGSAINIDSGASIVNSGTATGFGMDSESAYAGVLETNANFIDQAIFGPSMDGQAWNGKWSVASLYSSLMLVTIEDTGADTQVNIWDLTEVSSSAPSTTPLGTVTLSGDATPTSVAACMGYIIVGSEDGISIIDPHSGSWAERTAGWPRSLSTSTTPALLNNSVASVAAGFSDPPAKDPRTGGGMPTFAIGYGAGASVFSVVTETGNVWDNGSGTTPSNGISIDDGRIYFEYTGARMRHSAPISTITSDTIDTDRFMASDSFPYGLGANAALSMVNGRGAAADSTGLTLLRRKKSTGGVSHYDSSTAAITTTYNTGNLLGDIRGAWLANSATADRSYKGNTLTANGSITAAAVASGAELQGYSGFSSSNYLSRAHDADFDFGTGNMSWMGWIKSSGAGSLEYLHSYTNAGSSPGWAIEMTAGGLFRNEMNGSSVYRATSVTAIDDGVWHFCVMVWDPDGADEVSVWVDGVKEDSASTSTASTITNASGTMTLGGLAAGLSPATSSTMALVRLSATVPSATQIRQMYDAEKPMFVASAECLLQGASDAVLDVDVDPLTGKVLVTQSDSISIWDGLAIDSKPTVNSGSSEKGKLWGALRAEQNSANAYVTAPAVDQRQVNEMVRGLASDMPGGVDLSKAKAWCQFDGGGTVKIHASYNVKSLTDLGTGNYEVAFAIPFKAPNSGTAMFGGGVQVGWGAAGQTTVGGTSTRFKMNIQSRNSSGTLTDDNYMNAIAFGELENE